MPSSWAAQAVLILPAIGGWVIRTYCARVGVVNVTAANQDLAVDNCAGMATSRDFHWSFHLPLVRGWNVALDRCLAAFRIASPYSEQEAIEGVEAEMSALLNHVSQVDPCVESGVISDERNICK